MAPDRKWKQAQIYGKTGRIQEAYQAYEEISCELELARMENDGEAAKRIVEEMLDSVETICDFQKAPLYAHMKFREIEGEFYEDLKEKLRDGFQEYF